MTAPTPTPRPPPPPNPGARGLCATCTHVRTITSAHGATFYLCHLSTTDPRFPKYPPQPVAACPGYLAAARLD